jgi:tetratricopeptide (TPR) repeat protein
MLIDVAGNLVAWLLTGGEIAPWLTATLRVITYVLIALTVIAGIAFALYSRRSRDPDQQLPPIVLPAPAQRQPSIPHRVRLFGRRAEVAAAIDRATSDGLVAIVGPRDIGTSAVAWEVVERLSYDRTIHDPHVVPFDVRSRSHAEPADPRAVAGQLLSAFGLDEPADDTPEVLAEAAQRLLAVLHERRVTLVLDNVSLPEQVSWLTDAWSRVAPPPLLVIAGEEPVAAAFRGASAADVVFVAELALADLRDMLRAELGQSSRGARDLLRAVFGGPRDAVDDLLASFHGRPRAVQDIARALRESGRQWDLAELARELAYGSGALDGLWAAILRRKQGALSESARWLMHVLAELPVTELDGEAIDAMLDAGPEYRLDRQSEGGRHPLAELTAGDIVRESPPGRYRLPTEVRQAIPLADPGWPATPAIAEAVRRLVGYYAEQARNWTTELVTATARGPAMAWLHQQEGLLRALLRDWPEATAPLDDLAAIADVLDIWYGREQQSVGLRQTGERLRALALRADRGDLVQLATVRIAAAARMAGRLDQAEHALAEAERATPSGGSTGATNSAIRARLHNERALVHYARAVRLADGGADPVAAADTLDNADRELRQAWATVPRADVAGAVSVLINMAAVCLGQNRPLRAQTHLDLAETIARTGGDLSGEAQVIESQGVVAARRRRFELAVRLWQRANGRYAELGEEQGQARCLQHLGSAALVVPEVAGLLHTGRPVRRSGDQAARVALPLLRDSKRLRAGQPNTELVDHYLRLAAARLSSEM